MLTFGDFSQLHKWRDRTSTKGKGNCRRKALRFRTVVIKEWMSTMKCSNCQGDLEVETFHDAT
jgi:hypothetical protein